MHCLLFLGMNLVRLFSLAGLLLLSAFWEVPYFAAPVPEKQHLTQHLGPIQNRHPPVGKTTCDTEAKETILLEQTETNVEIVSLTLRT